MTKLDKKKSLKITKGHLKKDRLMTNRKRTTRINHDLQNITHKIKEQVTQTKLKPEVNSCVRGEVNVPAPLVAEVVLLRYKPSDKSFMSKRTDSVYEHMYRIRERERTFGSLL